MYGSVCDSRWHEQRHGTAFKAGWMTDVLDQIASFHVVRNPVNWRWSHPGGDGQPQTGVLRAWRLRSGALT